MQQTVEKKWGEERTLTSQSLSRFLLFSMIVLAFFSYLNYSLDLKALALVEFLVLLTLPPVYSWLRKGAPLGIVKHLIGFDTLVIFAPLMFIPTAGNTGIYWIFGYPMIAFFFLGTRTGFTWTMVYSLILVAGIALSHFGVLTLYYTPLQTALALIELIIFTAIAYFFTSDREKAENMHVIHLHYLQSVDKLERILHHSLDMDQALNNSLEMMLEIFSCSRAYLLHPLDMDSKYWNVAYEKSVLEFPGSFSAGGKIPTNPEMFEELRNIQDSSEIHLYGINRPIPGSPKWAEKFSIKSVMAIMISPEHGKPWMLGLHECTHSRIWTEEEQRLFKDIARRMVDALNQMLLYRELTQSEKNLRKAIKQAEAASHAKSEFLSVMSHELRTPLHGIIGLQDLISSDAEQLSSEQQENLVLAQQSAKSLRALVSDVLDLAKIESGNMEIVKDQFELKSCVCDALVPFILAARKKEIVITLHMEEAPKTIIGDESRLRQVLLNLVGNAVKFTEHGQVSVHVIRKEGQLHFSVKDTGIGISKADLKHIFEPFIQALDSNQPEHRGTGLGTSIVKRFVELMKGNIEATSELGKGSCFSFTIPCHPVGTETTSCHDSSTEGLFISAPVLKEEKKELALNLRVLLAEDDPIGQRIASKQLSKAGMKVDVVSDGDSAWEKIQNHSYDLLLTDIRMPGMNGITLTKKIRAMEKQTNKPRLLIIGLSAHALEDVASECLEAGMDHFMTKPVDPETILSTVTSKTSQPK
ncbi:MAG: response regulator [Mariprofundaceae bacterium]|nr:response regulator [Mariprofundaceae bacterium]